MNMRASKCGDSSFMKDGKPTRRNPLMKRYKHLRSLPACAILFITLSAVVGLANAAQPTQNVNVVNTPTVNVGNTASNPVPISSEPGRDPFQKSFVVIFPPGIANGGAFEVVPFGKRAVIEHVSVYASGVNAATADYFITSTIGGDSAFREVPIVTALSPSGSVIGSQSYRAFADPETQFGAVIRRQNTTNAVTARFVITGYFVPAP